MTYTEIIETLVKILRKYHDALIADGFPEVFARELVKEAQQRFLGELLSNEVKR